MLARAKGPNPPSALVFKGCAGWNTILSIVVDGIVAIREHIAAAGKPIVDNGGLAYVNAPNVVSFHASIILCDQRPHQVAEIIAGIIPYHQKSAAIVERRRVRGRAVDRPGSLAGVDRDPSSSLAVKLRPHPFENGSNRRRTHWLDQDPVSPVIAHESVRYG